MIFFAETLFFIFLLKLSCVALLTLSLREKFNSWLEGCLVSWCVVQTALYAILIVLSIFSMLTTPSIWLATLILLAGIAVFAQYTFNNALTYINRSDYLEFGTKQSWIFLTGILIVFFYFFYHSLYFYDTSADAFSYGMTRINFYAHYHTIFFYQPTISFNIFSNEWNGELNSLYYVLATHRDQAATFANGEVWLLLCFSLSYFAYIFNVSSRFRMFFAFAFGSAPVFLGLAMLVKGDLLCIATFILGFCFFLKLLTTKNNFIYFFATISAFSISAGAKLGCIVSVVFFILFSFLILSSSVFLDVKTKIRYSLLALIISLINCSKYAINLYVYKDPFHHLEIPLFLFGNIYNNFMHLLIVTADLLWAELPFPHLFLVITPGFLWLLPLMVSSCLLGLFFTIKDFYQIPKLKILVKLTLSQWVFLILSFFSGFIVLLSSIYAWHDAEYRYYVSWVLILLGLLTIFSNKFWRKINKYIFFSVGIFFATFNYLTAFVPLGEQTTIPFYIAMTQSPFQRLTINIPEYGQKIGNFSNNVSKNANLLILNGEGKIVSPFFGTNYRNNLYLLGTRKGSRGGLDKSLDMLDAVIKDPSNYYDYIILTGLDYFTEKDYWALKEKLAGYHFKEVLVDKNIKYQEVYIYKKMV